MQNVAIAYVMDTAKNYPMGAIATKRQQLLHLGFPKLGNMGSSAALMKLPVGLFVHELFPPERA